MSGRIRKIHKNRRKLAVKKYSVSAIQAHDAIIAAALETHNIENLLTFNAKDFKRYADIKAVEPKDI